MIYRVSAHFRTDMAAELRRRLADGSIATQQPDGQPFLEHLQALPDDDAS